MQPWRQQYLFLVVLFAVLRILSQQGYLPKRWEKPGLHWPWDQL
jgi:hypothetical protein